MALIFKDRPCDFTKPNGYTLVELLEIAKKLRINILEPRKSKALPAIHRPMNKICEDIAAKLIADPTLEDTITHIVNGTTAPKKGKKLTSVIAPPGSALVPYVMSDLSVLTKIINLIGLTNGSTSENPISIEFALDNALGSINIRFDTIYPVRIQKMIPKPATSSSIKLSIKDIVVAIENKTIDMKPPGELPFNKLYSKFTKTARKEINSAKTIDELYAAALKHASSIPKGSDMLKEALFQYVTVHFMSFAKALSPIVNRMDGNRDHIRDTIYEIRSAGIYSHSDIAMIVWANLTADQKVQFGLLREKIYNGAGIAQLSTAYRIIPRSSGQKHYITQLFKKALLSTDANQLLTNQYDHLWSALFGEENRVGKLLVFMGGRMDQIMTQPPSTKKIIDNAVNLFLESIYDTDIDPTFKASSEEYYNNGIGRMILLLVKMSGTLSHIPAETFFGAVRLLWFGQKGHIIKPFNDSVLLTDIMDYGTDLIKSYKDTSLVDLTTGNLYIVNQGTLINIYDFWGESSDADRQKWKDLKDPFGSAAGLIGSLLEQANEKDATVSESIIKTIIVRLYNDSMRITIPGDGSDDDKYILSLVGSKIVTTAETASLSKGADAIYDTLFATKEHELKELYVFVPDLHKTVIISGYSIGIPRLFDQSGKSIESDRRAIIDYLAKYIPGVQYYSDFQEIYNERDKIPGVSVTNTPRIRLPMNKRIFRALNRVVRKYISNNQLLFSDLNSTIKAKNIAAKTILNALKVHGDFLTGLHLRHRAYIASLDKEIGCGETDFQDACPSKHVLSASTTGRFMKYSGGEPIIWDKTAVVPNVLATGMIRDNVINAINRPPANITNNIISSKFTEELAELPVASALMEWNNIIMNAPKTSRPIVLYRGITTETPSVGDYMIHGTPFSTTMVSEMAESFPGSYGVADGGCCLLLIKVPAGYPFLFLGGRPSEKLADLKRKFFEYSTDPLEFSKANQFEVQMPATRFKVISIKDKVYDTASHPHFRRAVSYSGKRTIKQVIVEPELIYPVVVNKTIYVEPTLKRAIIRYNQYDIKKYYKLVEIPKDFTPEGTGTMTTTKMTLIGIAKISDPDTSYIRTIDVVPNGPLVEIIRELWEKNKLLVYNTDPYSWTTINHRAHTVFLSDIALYKYTKNSWFTGFNESAYISTIAKAAEILSE